MLQYRQCKIDYRKDNKKEIQKKLAAKLHIRPEEITDLQIVKKSIDARKKLDIFCNYTVAFSAKSEDEILKHNRKNANLSKYEAEHSLAEEIPGLQVKEPEKRIVIVGAGPAGLLCAYFLAFCGYKPILIERGGPMMERMQKVAHFWKSGELDPQTNVSFGEGGAGTFSDGKLNTGVKDKTGKRKFILDTFIAHGAPEEIRYQAKPHIGTDKLRGVIQSMREEMEELGVTYYFHTQFMEIEKANGKVEGVVVKDESGQQKEIPCDACVLAIGHSARDTFQALKEQNIPMEAKPFAVGVRVEHRQDTINLSQYGTLDDRLPAADYKLTGRTSDDRGVYSFCMCPGGYVVNASSEPGFTVVNGMSNHGRDSENANSAIVVSVTPEDYPGDDVLAGVEFQRALEKKTFELGRGKIPVQRLEDFCTNRKTEEFGKVHPCTKGEVVKENLKNILPPAISNGIMEGMKQFGRKIKGFDDGDTLLLGTETRTSSPVRILREDTFMSPVCEGLYPCGEGAGYAGGIMSAAMDGLRVALAIARERKE